MTLAVRIISLVMLVSLLGCASQIVQTSQPVIGENAGGTTQKTGDANDHLSSWILNVRSLHGDVSRAASQSAVTVETVSRANGCSRRFTSR